MFTPNPDPTYQANASRLVAVIFAGICACISALCLYSFFVFLMPGMPGSLPMTISGTLTGFIGLAFARKAYDLFKNRSSQKGFSSLTFYISSCMFFLLGLAGLYIAFVDRNLTPLSYGIGMIVPAYSCFQMARQRRQNRE